MDPGSESRKGMGTPIASVQRCIAPKMDERHAWREVLDPILARYERTGVRRYFRADAAFAKPGVYEYLEERRVLYAMRLPSNEVLQWEIAPLLRRPVGRPPKKPIIWYDDFWYQAGSWDRPRRVVAKVESRQLGQLMIGSLVFVMRSSIFPPRAQANPRGLGSLRPRRVGAWPPCKRRLRAALSSRHRYSLASELLLWCLR